MTVPACKTIRYVSALKGTDFVETCNVLIANMSEDWILEDIKIIDGFEAILIFVANPPQGTITWMQKVANMK